MCVSVQKSDFTRILNLNKSDRRDIETRLKRKKTKAAPEEKDLSDHDVSTSEAKLSSYSGGGPNIHFVTVLHGYIQ